MFYRLMSLGVILQCMHFTIFGQKNQIGLFANYNGNWSGINAELRYEYHFKSRMAAATSISSDFSTSSGVRFGGKYEVFEKNTKFGAWVGIDILLEKNKSLASDNMVINRSVLDLPIELRGSLTPKLVWTAGIIPNFTLANSANLDISQNIAVRLGLQHLF